MVASSVVEQQNFDAGHYSSRYYRSFTMVVQPFMLASCLDLGNIPVVRIPAILDRKRATPSLEVRIDLQLEA